MEKRSRKERVPTRATWPPSWLAESQQLASEQVPELPTPATTSSSVTSGQLPSEAIDEQAATLIEPEPVRGAADDPWAWEFANLTESDRRRLSEPGIRSEPCAWCGGRYRHHRLCEELLNSWVPEMPFGKHKGVPVNKVPHDYLRWLLGSSSSLSEDVRTEVRRVLNLENSN